MPKATPQRTVSLDPNLASETLKSLRDNLSALTMSEGHLWIGADEGTMIERLTPTPKGNFNQHQRFDLNKVLTLPAGDTSEIDIEGLDFQEGYLWVSGSHSIKRKKPDPEKTAANNRKRLTEVVPEMNRYTIARIPINSGGEPVAQDGDRRAAVLRMDKRGNMLVKKLRKDVYLGPACAIPSKENGLDIEGLAVSGDRLFLGLRGPVLRGRAIILELQWEDDGHDLVMKSLKRHFVDLHGLGVRDLMIVDRDLYILAGPTMTLDGPVLLFRWRKALDGTGEAFIEKAALKKPVLAVPFGDGVDHAEGMTMLPGKKQQLLVCYDVPAPARCPKPNQARLDVFKL